MKTYCHQCGKETTKNNDGYSVCPDHGAMWVLRRNAPCADAFILDGDNILLIRRSNDPFKGHWAMPGGHVEYGEHPHEGAVRETMEEAGIDIEITGIHGIAIQSIGDTDFRQVTVFYAKPLTKKVQAGDDALEAKWFDIKSLPKDMTPFHRARIDKHLKSTPPHFVSKLNY